MSILYSVDCTHCGATLIFHAPHREKWVCYFCGAEMREMDDAGDPEPGEGNDCEQY